MKRAKALIEEYREKFGKSISNEQTEHLKRWIENKEGIKIPGRLLVVNGKGGGQKYKLLYDAQNIHGNAGRPCTFYCEMPAVEKEMIELDKSFSKEAIQSGTFKLTDWEPIAERVKIVKELKNALGKYMRSELHIARGVNKMISYGFSDWDTLYRQVNRYISREMSSAKMNRLDGSEAMLAIVQKCYNRNRRPKVRIYDDLN